jgi:lipid-binding SYLF domain-containing protein
MRPIATGVLALAVCVSSAAASPGRDLSSREAKRIQEAAAVLRELRQTPDKDIPQALWNKARCVIVVPGLKKAAFGIGGEYGKGLMSCRTESNWSPPVFVMIAKGTWGLQIGAAEVDVVMLVMNDRGVEKLLGNKVTLGVDASVAAGPVGRTAAAGTDVQLQAEILAWSRSRGLFAGIDISGGVMKPDTDDTRDLYGREVSPKEILLEAKGPIPAAATPFIEALREHDAAMAGAGREAAINPRRP